MLLEEYYALQTKNILSRVVEPPGKVMNTKGERVFLSATDQLCWGVPVAATREKLELYAKEFQTCVEYYNDNKIAKINFDNISSPLLIPEVWALCSYDNYKDQFIKLMEITLQSTTELKDKKFDVDHWFSKKQVEEAKSESIYLRLILAKSRPNRSHGAASERKASDYKEEAIQHTKDLELLTPIQLLKALERRFSQAILFHKRNKEEKEEIITFLMNALGVPREIVEEKYFPHFYKFYYKNQWGQ
ncbi:TPA: hypothetical protein ACOQ31_006064 [Bacillus cereus]|uniref:Uncharacterized protein n=2 Tax=Bacillus cereus group TaxID=86661 RepID=A0A151V372_BACCE|nr:MULTISPECIES: hypothetical protein [Bacillus]COF11721.1 Uncharacterised protein [Streptococcus pneumoniae]KXY96745.1 hypothetical protein AT280_28745 [Bacillus cereus]KYQ04425.1 hypothetical protein B4079_0413 [Bacillus cereus]KZD50703.1 hypothetical protein B4088_6291 [Bacillus cereus]MBG9837016.1 hypothetical protein [Bacillus tropicus]